MLSFAVGLTGSYCVASVAQHFRNKKLLTQNKVKTLAGTTHNLKKLTICKEGIMYKILERGTDYTPPVYISPSKGGIGIPIGGSITTSYECEKFGYNFETKDIFELAIDYEHFMIPNHINKFFNVGKDYKDFFKEINVDPDQYQFTDIKVHYVNVKNDEVWTVQKFEQGVNYCKIMAKMDEHDFKKFVLSEYDLPLKKTNSFLFLCLFVLLACFLEDSYRNGYGLQFY